MSHHRKSNRLFFTGLRILAISLLFPTAHVIAGINAVTADGEVPDDPTWCFDDDSPSIHFPIDIGIGTEGWDNWPDRDDCPNCECDCPSPCSPPPVGWRLVLIDCEGNEIYRHESTISTCCCGSGGNAPFNDNDPMDPDDEDTPLGQCSIDQSDPEEEQLDVDVSVCDLERIPKRYRLEVFDGSVVSCAPEYAWRVVDEGDVPAPELTCDQSINALKCLSCDEATLPESVFQIYKTPIYSDSERVIIPLYTISEADMTGASWGEVVNGDLLIPGIGQLRLELDNEAINGGYGTSSLIVHGAPQPAQPGWANSTGPVGNPISLVDYCLPVTDIIHAGKRFEFNVAVARGNKTATIPVIFHWFSTDPIDCCVPHLTRRVEFEVMPLPCRVSAEDPVRPTLEPKPRHGGTFDYEVSRACCPDSKSGQAQEVNNRTAPFIMWPTEWDQVIRQGHAKGWIFTGSALVEPGAQETRHNFGG